MEFGKSKIQQVTFDVQYFEQESASFMQNRIVSDFNNYMQRTLDKKLGELTSKKLIKAKKIELDLGVLTKSDVENNLPAIFEKKLVDYLKSLNTKLEINNLPSGFEVVSTDTVIYEYLVNYFKYGILPWNLQELSEQNKIGYWIDMLYKSNPELLQELRKLFVHEPARKRLVAVMKKEPKNQIIDKLFGTQVTSIMGDIGALIKSVSLKISTIDTVLSTVINEQFFIWLAANQYSIRDVKISANDLATSFFQFVSETTVINPVRIFAVILEELDKPRTSSVYETQFQDAIKVIYFKEVQQRYTMLLIESPESLSPVYFNTYLQKNFTQHTEFIKQITEKLITILKQLYPTEDIQKIEGVIRGLIIESVKVTSPSENIAMWFKKLLEEITLVFGKQSHDKVREFIVSEQSKIPKDILMVEEFDSITIPSVRIMDGDKELNIKLQQIIVYFDLFKEYGINSLTNIFDNPVQVLYELIIALKEKHRKTYNKITSNFIDQAGLLTIKFLLEETKKEFFKHFIPDSFKSFTDLEFTEKDKFTWKRDIDKAIPESEIDIESDLSLSDKDKAIPGIEDYYDITSDRKYSEYITGEAIFIEILKKSYIPTYEVQRIGLGTIKANLNKYIEDNLKIIEQLLVSYSNNVTTAIVYLKTILTPQNFKVLERIIKEKDIVITTFEEKQSLQNLANFQMLLPYLLNNNITREQEDVMVEFMQSEIDTRSKEFAIYLISLKKQEIEAITKRLAPKYASKVQQLIKTYKLKYLPEPELELKEVKLQELEQEYKKFKEGEVIYIRNAGLVIINPYITMLFNRLGLTQNKKFKDDISKIKAVQLLQYIATKDDEPEEMDLVLNKILVGMEPYEPISEFQSLTKEEKEMCDGLVEAIIKNWSVLKSTTKDNLRASFFIRNGKLIFEEANWRLNVEQKSIDVLLDKMPWSFSTIKLPWMEHPLMTDWR